MSEREPETVGAQISGELAELFHQYREERGYNKSQAARRLMEESLLKENSTALRRLSDLRENIQNLESRLDRVEEKANGKDIESDRLANLEDRMQRLESIEWDTRRELIAGDSDE